MSPNTAQLNDSHVEEEFKMAVELCLERFQYSEQKELEFPSCFSGAERAYIHRMAQSLGYISRSRERGLERFITVWKKQSEGKSLTTAPITVSHKSVHLIVSLLEKFPVRYREDTDGQFSPENCTVPVQTDNSREKFKPTGFLHNSTPLVPNKRSPSELESFRCSLPIHKYQDEIVNLIKTNKVVLVVGENGSGKTTQIPQFILDDCFNRGETCRMFCSQPRRLAVSSVAERVAAERGETVGQTVGYHIRLENRISPKTLLTFCTHGVLLRTLMTGDASLKTVTHVILDDVDDRDDMTDFLLTKMRTMLQKIPTLKLILSSAAVNVDLLRQYFGTCQVLNVTGRQFEVKEIFLEDILKLTSFNPPAIQKHKDEKMRREKQSTCFIDSTEGVKYGGIDRKQNRTANGNTLDRENSTTTKHTSLPPSLQTEVTPEQLMQEMDYCISNCFFSEDLDSFNHLFDLICNKNANVDYKHSDMGATPLMVAASRGLLSQIEQLLNMGADVNIKATNGWTALDFARSCQHPDAVDLLQASFPLSEVNVFEGESGDSEVFSEDQELDLIMNLLHYICSNTCEGAVLIFVAEYSEILALRYRILYDDQRFAAHSERFQVFALYSDTQTVDQKTVMGASTPGVRRIILSTNIAESSITISDVVFVIDTGKVKEISFDSVSHLSVFKKGWISKASALQRKGRAGRCRPGICFHLFSLSTFSNMEEFKASRLLQIPLQGLCLQAKLLVPSSCSVADFLSKAPEPPPADAISKAVQRLMVIDAMDQDEELTFLGCYLADVSIKPHLGKMVLCAVVLKCLDPVLTIACILAYRDPFILPTEGTQRRKALLCRKHFSSSSFSDHMALLRAFQAWQRARRDGCERSFCERNFLSQATMEMIFDLRVQLLGQLRAIGFVRPRGSSNIHELNQNSENWAVVKAALVCGMYPNMFYVDQKTLQPLSHTERKIYFHPTSVLNLFKEIKPAKSAEILPTSWFIYDEICRGERRSTVRCCSLVTSFTVAIFGGRAMLPGSPLQEYSIPRPVGLSCPDSQLEDSDSDTEDMAEIKVDKSFSFQANTEAAGLLNKLKQMWQSLFIKRIRFPSRSYTQREEVILQILVSVLTEEEQRAGLQQPSGIGQRPWPMAVGDFPQTSVKNSESSSPQTAAGSDPDREASGLFQAKAYSRDVASLCRGQLSADLWMSCTLTPRSSPNSSPQETKQGLEADLQEPTRISSWIL